MKNLFLFTGEQVFDLQDKLRNWKKAFLKKYGEGALEEYADPSALSLENLITALQTEPFLSEKRMVIMNGLPPAADPRQAVRSGSSAGDEMGALDLHPLLTCLENLPETTIAIFVSPKPDQRTTFFKKLSSLGETLPFPLLKGESLRKDILQRLKKRGKTIDREALELFLYFCAEDHLATLKELEKLELLPLTHFGKKHIEQYITAHPEAKLFQTLELIGPSTARGLKSLELLLRHEDQMMIFFMIVRQFRLLLQVKDLLDKVTPREILQKRLQLAPFQVHALCKQAQYFSSSQLRIIYEKLERVDHDLKLGKIPLSGGEGEMLLVRLSNIFFAQQVM